MTIYNVHLYREMRLVFLGVEAASQEEAAHRVFQLPSDAAESFEDCEGRTLGALVDVRGDRDHIQSKMFDAKDGRLLDAAPQMLLALEEIVHLCATSQPSMPIQPKLAALALTAIIAVTDGAPSSATGVLCDPYPESILRDRIAGYDALEVHPVRSNPRPDGSTWCQPCVRDATIPPGATRNGLAVHGSDVAA